MDTGYIIDKNNAELRWLVYSTSEDWDKAKQLRIQQITVMS